MGIAYAEKLKSSGRIVLTFMGEGATSQGAVHEVFNLAAVWKVGVVFYVQNNHWAISLPAKKQTDSLSALTIGISAGLRQGWGRPHAIRKRRQASSTGPGSALWRNASIRDRSRGWVPPS